MEIGAWTEVGVTLATLILASATFLTVKEMHLQQKKDRLHKEMTLVVGQLHSHQDSDFFFGVALTFRPRRDESEDVFHWRTYYNFWDGIEVNMYLADPDLLSALQDYIGAREAYWSGVGIRSPLAFKDTPEGDASIHRVELARESLRNRTNERYTNLRNEIDQLEQHSWWQFWK